MTFYEETWLSQISADFLLWHLLFIFLKNGPRGLDRCCCGVSLCVLVMLQIAATWRSSSRCWITMRSSLWCHTMRRQPSTWYHCHLISSVCWVVDWLVVIEWNVTAVDWVKCDSVIECNVTAVDWVKCDSVIECSVTAVDWVKCDSVIECSVTAVDWGMGKRWLSRSD